MKTERKTAPAALRRGIAFLCTLVLTLMAVTLPASATLQPPDLNNSNIGLKEDATSAGENPFWGSSNTNLEFGSSWEAHGTTIDGTVKPQERYKDSLGKRKYQCCTSAYSTLTITNNSGKECLLSFSYTLPQTGSLTIDGTRRTGIEPFSKTLPDGGSVSVTLTTASSTDKGSSSTQSQYIAVTKLRDIKLTPTERKLSVEFKQPTNGSYTVTANGTPLDVGKTHSMLLETQYTLHAEANPKFVFVGWLVNGDLVSTAKTFTTSFSDNSVVEAKFADDPLLSIIKMSDPDLPKDAYVEVNSDYQHGERSWRRETVPDVTNGNNPVHFADPQWSVNGTAIQSSASGRAEGDYQNNETGNSTAMALLYSDVIRVKCLKSCTITFDWSMETTPKDKQSLKPMPDVEYAQFGAFFYYHISKNANVRFDDEKKAATGIALTKSETNPSGKKATITVNAGEYLYLSTYGNPVHQVMKYKGYTTMDYKYSATISNFTVTPNTTEHTFTTANEDNTEVVLKGGTVTVNNERKPVSSGPYTDKRVEGTVLTLKPGVAPTGYTFIGWHNVTDKTYDYTHDTYKVTMTKPYQVNPIYVPAMTIMTGGDNGYGSATYQYKSLSGDMVPSNGQLFVARNADCTKFYTDLNTAFEKESTVFLLAEDTINGSLTIPTNKTLVIPDRLADPGPSVDKPEQLYSTTGISSYCKVNLNGNLTVNGKLVVNAVQSSRLDGRATGGIGYLSLSGDSTVTVNSGGQLCGYGLIRGGSITAKDGSTVRELMEISDRRGDQITADLYTKGGSKGVFLFNNFSVKTIESRATYHKGSKLFAQYSVALDPDSPSVGSIPLFAPSGALFNLSQGSLTKSFDFATDKTVYRLNEGGKMSTGSFSLSLSVPVVGNLTIDTSKYWMPLNAGFDLRTAGEMTLASDFKFLPGASLSVEKGGTCTVANNANLLFYRLNDYDTREIGDETYQKGYSAKAYPVKAADLPGGGYTHPKLEAVGSARLNVDGKMIVNGGLYVSNELVRDSDQGFGGKEPVNGVPTSRVDINKAYFKPPYPYPNGYNVLTGTGTIKMNTALKDGTAYEAMTAKGTNAVAFAPIKITPIKGLAENATADNPDNYQPLKEATTYYGVYHLGGFYTWTDKMPQIAKIVGGGSDGTIYRSLADAVAAYDGTNGYIQMLDKSTEPGFTVDRNVTLDLNGKTVMLAGDLTVAKGFTLSGMDSSTGTGYDALPKGKIVGTVTGCAPTYQTPTVKEEYDRYVAIQGKEADGTKNLSFHHFNISVSGYRFELATGDTPQCALFFIGKFQGDKAAKDYLTSLGFTLKDKKDKQLGKANYEFTAGTVFPDMPDEGKESTSEVVRSGDAYLFEAYLMRSFDKENHNGYTEEIGATAQATFDNGGKQDSETQWLSFEEAWKNAKGLDETQQEILDKFLTDLGIK